MCVSIDRELRFDPDFGCIGVFVELSCRETWQNYELDEAIDLGVRLNFTVGILEPASGHPDDQVQELEPGQRVTWDFVVFILDDFLFLLRLIE